MIKGETSGQALGEATFYSRDEAREVFERTFERVEEDERLAPLLRAAGLRERLRLEDIDLTVDLAAGAEDDCLVWSFASKQPQQPQQPQPFEPKISLTMNASVANSILQGAESIGVAIARRRISVKGDAGAALVHLPAMRMICKHYRGLIEREYPHLVVGS